MKKITLFIAFLAISIGTVWGQEAPADGQQPISVTLDDGSTYLVYPMGETSNSAYAVLTNFSPTQSEHWYYTVCEKKEPGEDDICDLKYYPIVYEIPQDIPVEGYDYKVGVTGIACNLGGSSRLSSSVAYVLPPSITQIGVDGEANECFKFSYANTNVRVAVIFNSIPELKGNFDNLDNFISMNGNNKVVDFYQNCSCSSKISDAYSWIGKFTNASSAGKYVSFPYYVQFFNAYDLEERVDDNRSHPIYISQAPFGNRQLKVQLSGELYGSSDGSFHEYSNFIVNTAPSVAGNVENGTYSGELKNKTRYSVYPDCKAQLLYDKGNPFFSWLKDNGKLNNNKLFNKSAALTFKLDKSTGSCNNDNVPYWYYAGDNSSNKTISTDAAIHVEKEITSDHYRYFSLPFDCPINAIEVHLINGDGSIDPTNLALLPQVTDVNQWPTDEDYYVINEYQGQLTDDPSLPSYVQIYNPSCTLQANKGYAFALSLRNEETEKKAIITFKSRADNSPQEFTFDAWNADKSIAVVDNNSELTENLRNRGWNMIGNPYFHYLKPNSFYVESTGDGETTTQHIKYLSLINDNNKETVSHYWVDNSLGYKNYQGVSEVGQATNIDYIKPFQAFFVQVAATGSIKIQQGNGIADPPYRHLPAEHPDIQEHFSVKVVGQDGSFDRTTVINDETRDEHFKMMDDLAKIMNPGVQIYTWYDSVPCAFKELPMRADSTMAIPLGVRVEEAGNYTFALDTNLTFFYGAAMLHDKQMNQYHPLNEDGVLISLSVVGEVNDRFEVVIVPSEIPADVENVETSESLDAYVHDGRLVVENIEDGSTLSIFDVTGKMLYSAPAVSDFNYQFSAHGVYMVVLQGNTTGSIKVVY